MKKKILAMEVWYHYVGGAFSREWVSYQININLLNKKNNRTITSFIFNPTQDGGGRTGDLRKLKAMLNDYRCTTEFLLFLSELSDSIKRNENLAISLFNYPDLSLHYSITKVVTE